MATTVLNGVNRVVHKTSNVTTERMVITPQYAEALLAKTGKNRSVIKKHISHIQECLERGEWVFNGEPIIVAATGRVLDGQHRLIACCRSGVSIDTNIVFGVDESVFDTIDQGRSRSVGNVLDIDGESNCNSLAAAARHFWVFCHTGQFYDGGTAAITFTGTSARNLLAKHPDLRESIRLCMSCQHYKSKSLLAALHYLFTLSDPEFATEMVEILEAGGGNKHRPFHILREHVIHCRTTRVHLSIRSLSAKTIRAFNAEVNGEDLKKLQFRPDSSFPEIVGLDYSTLETFV